MTSAHGGEHVQPEVGGPTPRIRRTTVLRRVPDVTLRLDGAGQVLAEAADGRWVDGGPRGLWLLEMLQRPTTLDDLAAAAGLDGAQDWIDLTAAVQRLFRAGVVVDVDATPEAVASTGYVFDDEAAHARMLDDLPRTQRFIDAIEATVQAGDVVVDIGTGTGILAMAAARAGAAHVYAVEAGAIADRAERAIAANGLAERVTVLRGWSTRLDLPRRADVLVTETIGSEPLDERILETVADARRRLLVPGARVVPRRLDIWGTAVEVPEGTLTDRMITAERAAVWSERYGFDLGALRAEVRHLRGHRFRSTTCRRWHRLAPPQRLVSLDLATQPGATVEAEVTTAATTAGRLDGALVHFDAELAPGIVVSSNPDTARDDASWRNVLTLDPPVEVETGDRLRFTYRYRSAAGPAGLQVVASEGDDGPGPLP
jgi:predicted methyltransferase